MPEGFTTDEKGLESTLKEDKIAATTKAPAPPLQTQASSQPAASGASSTYPLTPTPTEEKWIKQALELTQIAFADAEQQWSKIRERIRQATHAKGYLRLSGFNLLDQLNYSNASTPSVQDIIHDVLFVAMHFRWNPDEVLALWENEGLPSWADLTHKPPMTNPPKMIPQLSLKKYYDKRVPRSEAEARVFARSVVLFNWWGLDVLTPVIPHKAGDNTLDTSASQQKNDQEFEKGFTSQLKPVLNDDPLRDLTDHGVVVHKAGGDYNFQVNPDYQATLLAMQHAHFKTVEAHLPKQWPGPKGTTVSLDPPFPALIYLYVNSKHAAQRVAYMVAGLKPKPGQKTYTSNDLYRAFLTTPLPMEVDKYLENCGPEYICDGYMNALRFEYARQVYSVLFKGINTIFTPRGFTPP